MLKRLYKRAGSPYWQAEILVGSTAHRISTGVPGTPGTRAKAREAAEAKRVELEQLAQHRSSASLKEAWALFSVRRSDLKASTHFHYGNKIAVVIAELGNPLLCEINPDTLRAYIKARRARTSDIQIRRELTALSSVLEFAADQDMDGAPEVNPTRLVRKKALAKSVSKPRWIVPEDVRRLYAAARGQFWPGFISLLLETGLRHAEALNLQWTEVDFPSRTLTVLSANEKTGRGRIVPLTDTALRTLEGVYRDPRSPYVFTNPRTRTAYKSIWSAWIKLRLRAGVPGVRIHDLRHTFASYVRQLGMARDDRMAIMGHTSEAAHEGYAKQSVQTLGGIMRKHSPSTLLTQERE